MKKVMILLVVLSLTITVKAGTTGANVAGICPPIGCETDGPSGASVVSGSGGKWKGAGTCGTFTFGGFTGPCGTLQGAAIPE